MKTKNFMQRYSRAKNRLPESACFFRFFPIISTFRTKSREAKTENVQDFTCTFSDTIYSNEK